MCCKLPAIGGLPGYTKPKPNNEWCSHVCKGKGCSAYDIRPPVCSEFECLWLHTQNTDAPLPLDMRPDKCGVILTSGTIDTVISVMVDPQRPLAWKRDDIHQLLCRFVTLVPGGVGQAVISHGANTDKIVIRKKPQTMPNEPPTVLQGRLTMTPPDETGMQWYVPGSERGFSS